ncbi:hypothetical protein QBC34DRAFT_476659 [Podospora aff. communis PSN243]|uniref:Oxidoreductase DRL-like catalytic domain-containing protein n=1 Tax=Podospora aff. communis PSN243 TaxID=3040156 RepID=A0AAV9G946_9PEZI|nr:hypothetical protein QBC34DRAFT_476659 [Podospora aff. communis PSN243]
MAAVANAAGLVPSDNGLIFTPGNVEEIATITRPSSIGGVLDHDGNVDVMSSEGVYVVAKATNEYVAIVEYPWHPDPTGQSRELNIPIANAALRGIATGSPVGFYGDVVATLKKDLTAGEHLDGEGRYTVWGKLVSARSNVDRHLLPVALAHHVLLKNDVKKGDSVSWDDVVIDESLAQALELRRETETLVTN